MLTAHVAGAGPLPPLLVCGAAGSGKSLLLAKWSAFLLNGVNIVYSKSNCHNC